MDAYVKVLSSGAMCLASLLGDSEACSAQQTPVTAIDIGLEPDATMVNRAEAANTKLRSVFPKGFKPWPFCGNPRGDTDVFECAVAAIVIKDVAHGGKCPGRISAVYVW